MPCSLYNSSHWIKKSGIASFVSPHFLLSHPSHNYGPHHLVCAPLGVAEMHFQQIERTHGLKRLEGDRKHLAKEAALMYIVQTEDGKKRKEKGKCKRESA